MRLAAIGFGLAALVAQANGSTQSTPMESSLFGIPIVKVHLLRGDGTSKEVRMVVDTGSEMSVLDRSIGPEFWTRDADLEGKKVEAVAAGGSAVTAEPVRVHQLQCGPLHARAFRAILLDLSYLNQTMDIPVAGLIGMNLLRDQTFLMDFHHQVICWNSGSEGLYLQNLAFKHSNGVPLVRLDVAGFRLEAVCDTGLTGFLTVSERAAKNLPRRTVPSPTSISVTVAGKESPQQVRSISAAVGIGAKQWCDPDVEIEEEDLLGLSAMWPFIWLDFRGAQVGFKVGPNGCLDAKPAVRQSLHAVWDRSGATPRLVILGVKSGSVYERAGLRAGDRLLAFGDLQGDSLNLATLRAAVLSGKARSLSIMRNERPARIELPEPK
ncbi:MAG TPA: aspartyl protease family protein [Geothrix sp.]|nr:aspartyl protease family protein [Geothrix sp.]